MHEVVTEELGMKRKLGVGAVEMRRGTKRSYEDIEQSVEDNGLFEGTEQPDDGTEQFVGIVEAIANDDREVDVAQVKTIVVWDGGLTTHGVPRACLEQLGCANTIRTRKIMRGAEGHRVRHYGRWWITALFGASFV